MSWRTIAPPSENECVETFGAAGGRERQAGEMEGVAAVALELVVVDDGRRARRRSRSPDRSGRPHRRRRRSSRRSSPGTARRRGSGCAESSRRESPAPSSRRAGGAALSTTAPRATSTKASSSKRAVESGGEGARVDAGDAAEQGVRPARVPVPAIRRQASPSARPAARSPRAPASKRPSTKTSSMVPASRNGIDAGGELRAVDRGGATEGRLRHRRDVGEAPLLLAQGREALALEVLPGAVAQRPSLGGRSRRPAARAKSAAKNSAAAVGGRRARVCRRGRGRWISVTELIAAIASGPRPDRDLVFEPGSSPWPRARAPAPRRPSARCGRRAGRARSPARCSRAGAGSG